MTKREKILRDALDNIEKREWAETEVGPPFEGKVKVNRTLSGENAFEAIKQADAVKSRPSEEDKKKMLNFRELMYDGFNPMKDEVKWLYDELSKYMGIE